MFYNFMKNKTLARLSLAVFQGLLNSILLMDKILHDPKDPKLWEL